MQAPVFTRYLHTEHLPVRRALWGVLLWLTCTLFSTSTLAQDSGEYRLAAGDKISIQVFDEDDLTMESRIGDSGVMNYSYLGSVGVAGKTTVELEKEITALLKNGYLVNPSVNITITEYRPFFIDGEVKSPGDYPYQPGLTLDKAISLAGGLTDRASTRKMYLIKASDTDKKSVKVKMKQRIQPGDIITIKEGFF